MSRDRAELCRETRHHPGHCLSGTRSSGPPGAERSSGAASLRGTSGWGRTRVTSIFRSCLRYVTSLTKRLRIRRRNSSGPLSSAALSSGAACLSLDTEVRRLCSSGSRFIRLSSSRTRLSFSDSRSMASLMSAGSIPWRRPSSFASFSSWSSLSLRSSWVRPFRPAFCRLRKAACSCRSIMVALRGSRSSEHTTSHDELHEPVIAKPGPAPLALPEDDHLPALAESLRRAHSVAAAEDESSSAADRRTGRLGTDASNLAPVFSASATPAPIPPSAPGLHGKGPRTTPTPTPGSRGSRRSSGACDSRPGSPCTWGCPGDPRSSRHSSSALGPRGCLERSDRR